MSGIFFNGWASLGRIVVLAVLVYVSLVVVLRLIGPRALAKMSAYDLIVTVALGSLVASIPLQKSVSLADGLVAAGAYLLLQRFTSEMLTHWPASRGPIEGSSTLVLWDGQILHDRMTQVAITPEEIHAAVRSSGRASLAQVLAVVLERDGSWSVVGQGDVGDLSALRELDIPWPMPRAQAATAGREAGRDAT